MTTMPSIGFRLRLRIACQSPRRADAICGIMADEARAAIQAEKLELARRNAEWREEWLASLGAEGDGNFSD